METDASGTHQRLYPGGATMRSFRKRESIEDSVAMCAETQSTQLPLGHVTFRTASKACQTSRRSSEFIVVSIARTLASISLARAAPLMVVAMRFSEAQNCMASIVKLAPRLRHTSLA